MISIFINYLKSKLLSNIKGIRIFLYVLLIIYIAYLNVFVIGNLKNKVKEYEIKIEKLNNLLIVKEIEVNGYKKKIRNLENIIKAKDNMIKVLERNISKYSEENKKLTEKIIKSKIYIESLKRKLNDKFSYINDEKARGFEGEKVVNNTANKTNTTNKYPDKLIHTCILLYKSDTKLLSKYIKLMSFNFTDGGSEK